MTSSLIAFFRASATFVCDRFVRNACIKVYVAGWRYYQARTLWYNRQKQKNTCQIAVHIVYLVFNQENEIQTRRDKEQEQVQVKEMDLGLGRKILKVAQPPVYASI